MWKNIIQYLSNNKKSSFHLINGLILNQTTCNKLFLNNDSFIIIPKQKTLPKENS